MGLKKLVALLLVLVMVGGTVSPVMAANTRQFGNSAKIVLKPPKKLTKTELKKIYKIYRINKNDIKFAEGKLPYYLNGTVLDGSKKIIVTDTGKIPKSEAERLKEMGINYMVMSWKEVRKISERARREYIRKYGVDPANPKVVIVQGVPLPREYVRELVARGVIRPRVSSDTVHTIATSSLPHPHEIDGKIIVKVFVAKDNEHKPDKPLPQLENDTSKALKRFESEFGISMESIWYIGFWDASDVSDAHNTSQVLDDLKNDCSWAQDSANTIIFGWADDLDHNGMAYQPGFYAVGAETPTHLFDFPDNIVVQHEISHNFNAPDHGDIGPYCVMTYLWAYLGVDTWCQDCWNTIDNCIWS